MIVRLDFTSEAFFRDPPKAIATLRMSGPVVATRFPLIGDVWITTTHDATAQVLKDGATVTLRKEDGDVAGLRWWMPRYVRTIANNMLTMDEPDHTRLRSIVDEAFRRRAIVAMEPRIRAIADGLADELFANGSPADLVQRYARILPLAVISELLGLPLADRPRFIAWANAMSSLTNVVSFFRLLFAFRKMRAYLERQLQIARERGGEGLIAELIQVEREGGQITPDLGGIDGQAKSRPAHEQRFQRASRLDARELMAEAEMDSCPERDVTVRLAFEIELFRVVMHRRIHVRSGEHHHDTVALARPGLRAIAKLPVTAEGRGTRMIARSEASIDRSLTAAN